MAEYGITGNLLLWLNDFLHNRSQVTQVGDAYSSENNLVSGIVQGSCLGPLLFVIYINDVTEALRSDCTCQLLLFKTVWISCACGLICSN